MATIPDSRRRPDLRDERGIALIVSLMAMMLLTALGVGLLMTTTSETLITNNYRSSSEAFYAADAGVERVMQDLLTVPDWNRILRGELQSAFTDGPPSGERALPGGGSLNLTSATNMLNCAKTSACSDDEMNAWTAERPWTTNNPRWQLYAYGPLAQMIETGTVVSPMYVVVWVADDSAENDGLPTADGTAATNPGRGVISLRAEAFGPSGVRQAIEVTVARTDTTELERGYTGQRGQDEQNRRARKAAVQSPGKALSRATMGLATGTLVSQ
ncbi:MAG: pilus assembly PilX N-terminal domain-containing protein [Acidobacteriota bacterium]